MSDVASAVGGAVGGGLGDLIGYLLSQGDRDAARKLIEGANPNVAGATGSAEGRGDMQAALAQLKQQWQNNGLDPIARAQISQAERSADSNAQALNRNIGTNMDQRGMGGSLNQFAMQGQNAGREAERASMADQQVAAGAYGRGQAALSSYLGGAEGLRSGDDALSRFNVANSQQNYQNRMQQAGGLSGLASQTVQTAQGVGQGIGSLAGTAVGAAATGGASLASQYPDVVPGKELPEA